MNGLTLLVLFAVFYSSHSYIWEGDEDPYLKFGYIPPIRRTSNKMSRFFMGIPSTNAGRVRRGPGTAQASKVVFVVDSSSSVGRRQFKHELKAIHTIIKRSTAENRYAVVVFSSDASIRIKFTDRLTAMRKVNNIRYTPGKTNIQKGLFLARELFLDEQSSGLNGSAPMKVLLITDGLSNVQQRLTLYRSFQLKMMGAQIYVIASGRMLYGAPETVGIATTPSMHFFRVYNMKAFLKAARMLPVVARKGQLSPTQA